MRLNDVTRSFVMHFVRIVRMVSRPLWRHFYANYRWRTRDIKSTQKESQYMRHNKLAGTRFLLGSRKHKPSTFTSLGNTIDCNCGVADNNNMLHSKSTYFYRWFSEHLDLVVSGLSTKNTNKVSKASKTSKASYLVPAVCGAALLGALGFIVNPAAGKAEAVYAAGESGSATTGSSISITFNKDSGGNPNTTTTIESGIVSYISNSFTVDTENIYKYDLIVSAAAGRNSQLTGTTYHGIIDGVGTTALSPSAFKENTWGYNFATTDTDIAKPSEQLTYTTLPEFSETLKPQYSSLYDLPDTDSKTFKLTFAARIMGDTRPADHYYTQAMISAIASAKGVVEGFGGVQTMQEFTSEICKNKVTTGTEGRLEDTRKNADGSTNVYWVAKLKDGNCWMTQNLDLGLSQGKVLSSADTNVAIDYTVPSLGYYSDPGEYLYIGADKSYAAAGACNIFGQTGCDPYFKNVENEEVKEEDAHYLIGDFYPYNIAIANSNSEGGSSICAKGWRLPTRAEFDALKTNEAGSEILNNNTIRKAPYYFIPSGRRSNTTGYQNAGNFGNYWSSTPGSTSSKSYFLAFDNKALGVGEDSQSHGFSVRCIISGQ